METKLFKIVNKNDNLIFTPSEFKAFVRGFKEAQKQGDKVLTDYLSYTMEAQSIRNLKAELKPLTAKEKRIIAADTKRIKASKK